MPSDCNNPERTLPCSECCSNALISFVESKIIFAQIQKFGFPEFENNGTCLPKIYLTKSSDDGSVVTTVNPENGCTTHTSQGETYEGDFDTRVPVNAPAVTTTTPTRKTWTIEPQVDLPGGFFASETLSNENTTSNVLSIVRSRVASYVCNFENLDFSTLREVQYVRVTPLRDQNGKKILCSRANYELQCQAPFFGFAPTNAALELRLDELGATARKMQYRIGLQRPEDFCPQDGPVIVRWRQRTRVFSRENCEFVGDPETSYEDFEQTISFSDGEPEEGHYYVHAYTESQTIDVPQNIDTIVDVVGPPARARAQISLQYKSRDLSKYGFPAFRVNAGNPRIFKRAVVTGTFAGCAELNLEPRNYDNAYQANSPLTSSPAWDEEKIGFFENIFTPVYYPLFVTFPDRWQQFANDYQLPPLVEETETKRVWRSVIKCGGSDVEHRIEVNLSDEVTIAALAQEITDSFNGDNYFENSYFENSQSALRVVRSTAAQLNVALSIPYAFSNEQTFNAVLRKRTTRPSTGEMTVTKINIPFTFAPGETFQQQTIDLPAPASDTRIEYAAFDEDQETHLMFTQSAPEVRWARVMNVPINPKTGWEV